MGDRIQHAALVVRGERLKVKEEKMGAGFLALGGLKPAYSFKVSDCFKMFIKFIGLIVFSGTSDHTPNK